MITLTSLSSPVTHPLQMVHFVLFMFTRAGRVSFSAYVCARSHQLRRAERWLSGAYATTYTMVLWASEGRDCWPGLTDHRSLASAWALVVAQSQTSTQSLVVSGPWLHHCPVPRGSKKGEDMVLRIGGLSDQRRTRAIQRGKIGKFYDVL